MNLLQQYILDNDLNETGCMNLLQGFSTVISDCCVNASDVADDDCAKAVETLKGLITP